MRHVPIYRIMEFLTCALHSLYSLFSRRDDYISIYLRSVVRRLWLRKNLWQMLSLKKWNKFFWREYTDCTFSFILFHSMTMQCSHIYIHAYRMNRKWKESEERLNEGEKEWNASLKTIFSDHTKTHQCDAEFMYMLLVSINRHWLQYLACNSNSIRTTTKLIALHIDFSLFLKNQKTFWV